MLCNASSQNPKQFLFYARAPLAIKPGPRYSELWSWCHSATAHASRKIKENPSPGGEVALESCRQSETVESHAQPSNPANLPSCTCLHRLLDKSEAAVFHQLREQPRLDGGRCGRRRGSHLRSWSQLRWCYKSNGIKLRSFLCKFILVHGDLRGIFGSVSHQKVAILASHANARCNCLRCHDLKNYKAGKSFCPTCV